LATTVYSFSFCHILDKNLAMKYLCACGLLAFWITSTVSAAEPAQPFKVKLETVLKHDDGKFIWFHPRAVAIPGSDVNDPQMLMTLQKHLNVSDFYSGLHVLTRKKSGEPWVGPELPAELDWKKLNNGITVSVADVTPGWHAATGRVIAIGAQVRYSTKGHQLDDIPRAHCTVYAVFNPQTHRWTPWQRLELPPGDEFNFARNACSQWIVRPNWKLLIPLYIAKKTKMPFSTTVAECNFDGEKLTYQRHGNIMRLDEGRGLGEPSLVEFGGRFFLTMRNELRGYVCRSDDGLKFTEPQYWLFDNGGLLDNYNTQQHWLAHSDGLFLVYTRKAGNNNHIMRHRAPLFMAQVDPDNLRVFRRTEQIVVPERGAELGNFGCNPVSPTESWVTVSEGMFMKDSRQRGAEGATFVARILWKKPNRLMGK
jgi:hypothetical protein